MQRITVKPRYVARGEFLPGDVDYPELTFLFDDKYAISTDGWLISLFQVEPVDAAPGVYRAADDWHYIHVGIDDERTVEGLREVVEKLKTMSAFEMLTQHFNQHNDTFFVNRDRMCWDSPPGGESEPRPISKDVLDQPNITSY